MYCIYCGRRMAPGSGACPSCGKPVKSSAGGGDQQSAAEEPAPGSQTIDPLQDELSNIEFTLGMLEGLEGQSPPSKEWQNLRSNLTQRRKETEQELIKVYGALNTDHALTKLDQFLRAFPNHVDALLARGLVHTARLDFRIAQQDFLRAVALAPARPEAHLELARVYEQEQVPIQAIYEYRLFLNYAKDPDERALANERIEFLRRTELTEPETGDTEELQDSPDRLDYVASSIVEYGTDAGLDQEEIQQAISRITARKRTLEPEPERDHKPVTVLSSDQLWELASLRRLVGKIEALERDGVLTAAVSMAATENLQGRVVEISGDTELGTQIEIDEDDPEFPDFAVSQLKRLRDEGLIDESSFGTLSAAYLDVVEGDSETVDDHATAQLPDLYLVTATSQSPTAPAPAPQAVTAEVSPPRPPRPPRVARPTREPFDWGAFWVAVFSQRSMTTTLGLGVFLVAISSLALLVNQWGEFSVWEKEGFLIAQFAVFLGVGHLVKERIGLQLSGLALISIAALWIPLIVGALLFELVLIDDVEFFPGIDIPRNGPIWIWLVVSASAAPAWAFMTWRYRGHVLAHGTAIAAGATVALAIGSAGVGWEWGVASIAVSAIALVFATQRLVGTRLANVADPLFATAHIVPAVVLLIVVGTFTAGDVSGYSVSLAALGAAGVYATADHFRPHSTYRYVVTPLPVMAGIFALVQLDSIALQYYDTLLVATGAAYVIVARGGEQRQHRATVQLGRLTLPQPALAAGYLLVLAGLVWPNVNDISRTAAAYGAAAVGLVSVLWTGRAAWSAVSGTLVVAAALLTLNLFDGLRIGYWAVPIGGLAWVFLVVTWLLKRQSEHSAVTLAFAFGITFFALIWAFVSTELPVMLIVLPVVAASLGVQSVLIQGAVSPAMDRALLVMARLVGAENTERLEISKWSNVTLLTIVAILFPVWTGLLFEWAGVADLWTGIDQVAIAAIYALLALRLRKTGSSLVFVAFGAVGTALVISAPLYNLAAAGEVTWVMVGILYTYAAVAWVAARLTGIPQVVYVSAGALLPPFALTLVLSNIPVLLWSTPVMLMAVAYAALGLYLESKRNHTGPGMVNAGLGMSGLALGWTVFWAIAGLSGTEVETGLSLAGQRIFVSFGLFAGSALYAVLTMRRHTAVFGHLAAWALAGALGIVLVATPMSMNHAAIVVAVGSALFALTGAYFRRFEAVPATWDRDELGQSLVGVPLMSVGLGLAIASVVTGSVDLADRGGDVLSASAVYVVVAATLAGIAYLERAPILATPAAALLFPAVSLGIYDLGGESSAVLRLPSMALSIGWSALAIGYLATALVMEASARRYSYGLPILAYISLGLAVPAALGDPGRQSVVFGSLVGVAAVSAVLSHRKPSFSFTEVVASASAVPVAIARSRITFVFVTIATLLTPLWSLELLALFTTRVEVQGFTLALEAPGFLVASFLLRRSAGGSLEWPVHLTGLGMAAVATILTAFDLPLNVAALAVGSLTFVMSAYMLRGHAASGYSAWMAATLILLAGFRVLLDVNIPVEVLGLVLGLVAIGFMLLAIALSRRWPVENGIGWNALQTAPHLRPLDATGFAMSLAAIVLATPNGNETLSAVGYGVVAIYYGIAASRFRLAVLLYPAAGLAVVGYIIGLGEFEISRVAIGLAMLPGAAASLAVAGVLHRYVSRAKQGAPASALRRAQDLMGRISHWEVPPLVIGHAFALAAAGMAFPDEAARLGTLFALVAVYVTLTLIYRSAGWVYPALVSVHLLYVVAIQFANPALSTLGVSFVGPSLMMAAAGGYLLRGGTTGETWRTDLRSPWTLPFVVFLTIDIATSVGLSTTDDVTGIAMSGAYMVLSGAGAYLTGARLLPYVATAFATMTAIFASRLSGLSWSQSAVVWAAQGLVMWWGSQAVIQLADRATASGRNTRRIDIWKLPLRRAGLRLSWFALGYVVVLGFAGIVEPGRFGDDQAIDISTVMAVLGLLYVGMSFVSRRLVFGYIAVSLLLSSWAIVLIDRQITLVQVYAIPGGLYLLAIAYFERQRETRRGLALALDTSGMILLIGSSFTQSIVDDPAWPFVLLVGIESVLLVFWGAANRTRTLFFGGIVAFVLNVLWQVGGILGTMPGEVIGLVVGLTMVAAIAAAEWRRERLIAVGRGLNQQLRSWDW